MRQMRCHGSLTLVRSSSLKKRVVFGVTLFGRFFKHIVVVVSFGQFSLQGSLSFLLDILRGLFALFLFILNRILLMLMLHRDRILNLHLLNLFATRHVGVACVIVVIISFIFGVVIAGRATPLLIFLCNLLVNSVCEREIFQLLFCLGEKRDLFPYLNVMIGAFRVFLRIVSHELEVLTATIAFEPREDTHRDVVGHIFEDLLPPVNSCFDGEDTLHALVDTQSPKCNCAPNSTEGCLLGVEIVDVILKAGDFFFLA